MRSNVHVKAQEKFDGRSAAMAERIKEAREAKGMAQAELAKHIGVSRSAETQWELGLTQPSLLLIELLAHILDVTPEWIAFGEARLSKRKVQEYLKVIETKRRW